MKESIDLTSRRIRKQAVERIGRILDELRGMQREDYTVEVRKILKALEDREISPVEAIKEAEFFLDDPLPESDEYII